MAKNLQHQILTQARTLITDPEHWSAGRFAVGKAGRTLASGSPRAVRHCAVSAIVLASRLCVRNRRDADRIAENLMLMIAPMGSDSRTAEKYIWSINDLHGHAAVVELFDTALGIY
jgi:hypothetical protein